MNILEKNIVLTLDFIKKKEQYKNKKIFITGSTGFIGSLLTRTFIKMNEVYNLNITLIFYVRNKEKFKLMYSKYLKNTKYEIIIGDLSDDIKYDNKIDFIFHLANNTDSSKMIKYPVETILTIVEGTKYILNLAKEKKVMSMVYISSMEVYGKIYDNSKIMEEKLGELDILNIRSSYSQGKRTAENLCRCYYEEYDVPVKIARLAQVFGPGVPENDNRVFMQFIRSLINKEDIVLHTTGESRGNYCSAIDCITAIFTILTMGSNGEAYNVVNENTNMTIKEMAELVANEISDIKLNVKLNINKDINKKYAPKTNLHLSSKKLNDLGWKSTQNLKQMYIELYKYIVENK